jgi:hypothetical protein
LARALKRVFCSCLAVGSSGFAGSCAALAVSGWTAPASSVLACGALGSVFVGALPKRIFSFLPGFSVPFVSRLAFFFVAGGAAASPAAAA